MQDSRATATSARWHDWGAKPANHVERANFDAAVLVAGFCYHAEHQQAKLLAAAQAASFRNHAEHHKDKLLASAWPASFESHAARIKASNVTGRGTKLAAAGRTKK